MSIVFMDAEMERRLKTDPVATLRRLADAIETGELTMFRPSLRGNGMFESRYGRVVFDVGFCLEVPVHVAAPDPETETPTS